MVVKRKQQEAAQAELTTSTVCRSFSAFLKTSSLSRDEQALLRDKLCEFSCVTAVLNHKMSVTFNIFLVHAFSSGKDLKEILDLPNNQNAPSAIPQNLLRQCMMIELSNPPGSVGRPVRYPKLLS